MLTNHKLTALLCFLLTLTVIVPVSFGASQDANVNPSQNIQPTVTDNFDDNSLNQTLWTKIEVDGGTVDEQNGVLQVTTPSNPYSLSEKGYYGNYCQAGCITNFAFTVNSSN